MRLHIFEHEDDDLRGGLILWAESRGLAVSGTRLHLAEPLPDLDAFDCLIIAGGTMAAWEETEYPWLVEEKRFLRLALEADKPMFGICFGAQLLAEALGGHLFRNQHREIGWHEVSLTGQGRESFLFAGLPGSFQTFHWHNDHFSLPPDCVCLASSPPTPNQAYVSLTRPVAGLQFHPEFSREQARRLIETFYQDLTPGLFVPDPGKLLEQTSRIPETYPLLEKIMDNFLAEYAGRMGR